jgi:hypothetical protein
MTRGAFTGGPYFRLAALHQVLFGFRLVRIEKTVTIAAPIQKAWDVLLESIRACG